MGAQFFSDQSANISSTTNGFVLFSSLINWAPCAVQIAPVGVGVAPIGLNVQPGGAALLRGVLSGYHVCKSIHCIGTIISQLSQQVQPCARRKLTQL